MTLRHAALAGWLALLLICITPSLQWVFPGPTRIGCGAPLLDGGNRCRPLAALVNHLDGVLALADRLPAASLVWPLLFILAPALLFQVLRDRLGQGAAWAGVGLFVTAGGVASAALMRLTAAKPLAVVSAVVLLWLLHRLLQDRKLWLILALLSVIGCAHLLIDETGGAILFALPFLLPGNWRRGKLWAGLAAIAFGMVCATQFCRLLWPDLAETLGYRQNATLLGSVSSMSRLSSAHREGLLLNLTWTTAAILAHPLPLSDQVGRTIAPARLPIYPGPTVPAPAFALAISATLLSLLVLVPILQAAHLSSQRRAALSALVGLVVAECVRALVVGRMGMGTGAFYQSSVAALPYAILGAAVLADSKRCHGLLLTVMLLGSLTNSLDQSAGWRVSATVMRLRQSGAVITAPAPAQSKTPRAVLPAACGGFRVRW